MQINSDINVLGGFSDWPLISWLAKREQNVPIDKSEMHQFTSIKTTKSLTTALKVIKDNLLHFKDFNNQKMILSIIKTQGIDTDTLLLLFWNASVNNELFFYLNEKVFFPAFYSGRVSIKNDEVIACINDLKPTEDALKKWSEITISTTGSKYLTLLKKFGLMEGSAKKYIINPYLSDSMFIIFAYWLAANTAKPNLLDSKYLSYSFCEKQTFLDRLLQKKFSKYFNVVYTGDKLSIEPLIPYESIYEYITKS